MPTTGTKSFVYIVRVRFEDRHAEHLLLDEKQRVTEAL